MQSRHVLLQAGQIVQAWRLVVLLPAFLQYHVERDAGSVRQVEDPLRFRPTGVTLLAGQLPPAHGHMDRPERRGPVRCDLTVAFHDHRQRRGLHTAHGEARVVGEAVRAAGVHADQPVRFRADLGRMGETVVRAFGFHRVECLADRFLLQRGDPEPFRRLVDVGVGGDAAEYGLALTVGIACVDEFGHVLTVEESADVGVLPGRSMLVADVPPPVGGRVDGQRVHVPFVPTASLVVARHGEFDEVALRPGDQGSARRDVSVMVFHASQCLAYGLSDGMLLCDDESHKHLSIRSSFCRKHMRGGG